MLNFSTKKDIANLLIRISNHLEDKYLKKSVNQIICKGYPLWKRLRKIIIFVNTFNSMK